MPATLERTDIEPLRIAERTFRSRLILGTGKYTDFETMRAAHEASGAEMVTVAVRRVDLTDRSQRAMMGFIDTDRLLLLPNTAGCYTADDAVRTARLARELGGWSWIKLEVLGDEKTLFPDTVELLRATETLVGEGFTVLPYTTDDPRTATRNDFGGGSSV